MERDFSGTPFASLGKLTCNDNSGLKYEVARRVWPKVELCYASKQTIQREGDFCQTANNDKCDGGFQAQFKTNVEITPKVSATGAVEKLGRNAKVLIDVDVSLALKVVSGVSVLAGGKCSHTETRFLPKVPEKISLGCFFPGCVVLLIQGKVELSLSGTLMAGATAVHHTELAAKGNIRFAKGENNPKLSYERACGNKKNCFEYPEAKSGWRAETWGEMWGKVGVKIGPVFTVMVTPGLWASVTPWVSAEASMYGGMRYENYGGNIQISDELFGKYRIKDSKCLGGVSIPLNRSMYNTRQPSSGKTSKTNEQGQQQVQKNPNGGGASGVFFVASGDLKYCVAAALSLRVGVDIYGGLMPESFQGDVGKAKSYVKDTVCGKARSRSRNLQAASEPVSAFDQGFKDFLNPVQSNTANAGKREIDVFNKCLQEAKLEYTTNGQPTSRFFNPFNPRKYCEWGVDKVFDVISGRLDSGSIELYCRDFKYYSSETCANRVGCGASLQLVAPPARPLPGNY